MPRSELFCRSVAIAWLLILCAAFGSVSVAAHPADEINERDLVHVAPDGLLLDTEIGAGAVTLLTVWEQADTNRDGIVDDAEREAFGTHLAEGIVVRVDGARVPTHYLPSSLAMARTREAFMLQGAEAAGATVAARFAIPAGIAAASEVTLSVTHFAAQDGARTPELIPDAAAPLGIVIQGGDDVTLRFTVSTSAPQATPPSVPLRPSPSTSAPRTLTAFALRPPGDVAGLAFGLVVAMLLGALHALTPGHGKTMITAYLGSTRGRPADALILGGVVTLSHTGSVIALGVGLLYAARAWAPYRLMPWVELCSSLGIIALGGRIAWVRAMAVAPRRRAPAGGGALAARGTTGMHEHADGTVHAHWGSGAHDHSPPTRDSLRTITLVGLGGGIVPCPDALAILLVALAAGRLAFGLAIIFAFSVGLALVLIALGLIVTVTRLADRLARLPRIGAGAARWIPTGSALIMVLAGAMALGRALAAIR